MHGEIRKLRGKNRGSKRGGLNWKKKKERIVFKRGLTKRRKEVLEGGSLNTINEGKESRSVERGGNTRGRKKKKSLLKAQCRNIREADIRT